MADKSRQALLDSIKGHLASGDYSDLIVTCGSDTYNVHKMIVCSPSGFFARAVRFAEDEPAIVKLLMQYFYEADYEPFGISHRSSAMTLLLGIKSKKKQKGLSCHYEFPHSCMRRNAHPSCTISFVCPHHSCGSDCQYNCVDFNCGICNTTGPNQTEKNQLLTHSKMYEIADKYDVAGLKDLAMDKFDQACNTFWNSPDFPVAVRHAFSTTPDQDRGLRDVILQTLADHMELIDKLSIKALLKEGNGLALELLEEKRATGCL